MPKVDLSVPKVPTQAPKFLGEYGKRLWPKVAAYLNKNPKILKADKYLLEQYCSTYDLYRWAYQSVQEDGIQAQLTKTLLSPTTGKIVATDFLGFKKNPAVQTMSDALSKLNSIGRELGLSPKARSEMIEFNSPENGKDKKSSAEQMKELFG